MAKSFAVAVRRACFALHVLVACCWGYTLNSSQTFCVSSSALATSTTANETTQFEEENLLELVPVEEGDRIELQCQLCGPEGTETAPPVTTVSPRVWYQMEVHEGGAWREVQLGMQSPLTANRVYMTPQDSLVIQKFQTDADAGRYECRGLEGDDPVDPIAYLLDELQPLNASEPYVSGNLSTWSGFEEAHLSELGAALDQLAGDEAPDVAMHWAAWGPCEDCQVGEGLRWRLGRCRALAPARLHLLPHNLTAISCRSRFLDQLNVSESVRAHFLGIQDFVLHESCECRHQEYTATESWLELHRQLEEGDSLNLVCPKANAHEVVEWKKGMELLSAGTWTQLGKTARMRVDALGTLRIERADRAVAGHFSCRAASKTWRFLVAVEPRFVLASPEFRQHVMYLLGVLAACLVLYVAYVALLCCEAPEVRHKIAFGRHAPASPPPSPAESDAMSESQESLLPGSEDDEPWEPLTPARGHPEALANLAQVALEAGGQLGPSGREQSLPRRNSQLPLAYSPVVHLSVNRE